MLVLNAQAKLVRLSLRAPTRNPCCPSQRFSLRSKQVVQGVPPCVDPGSWPGMTEVVARDDRNGVIAPKAVIAGPDPQSTPPHPNTYQKCL